MLDLSILYCRENIAFVVPLRGPAIEENNAYSGVPTKERVEVVDLHRAVLDRRIKTTFAMTGVQDVPQGDATNLQGPKTLLV